MAEPAFIPLGVAVLCVSDTRTLETDTSGALIVSRLEEAGHRVVFRGIEKDELSAVRSRVEELASNPEVDVVLVTGGTGLTRRDVTPEAIEPLVTKPIPGFGELFRFLSYAEIGPATIQSRAFAALCGRALVFALPGSTKAVRLALEKIILPELDSRTRPCNFAELLPRMRGS
jgi:molybdenum cofactor biosynthesis protein B